MEGENKNTLSNLEFQERYREIIETPLSPNNIDSYADDAMDRLGQLIEDVQEEYKWEGLGLSAKEREDKIFAEAFPGTSVEATLDRIDDIAHRLMRFDTVIRKTRENPDNEVILPPDGRGRIVEGSGRGIQETVVLPKLKTELFVLEQDFGVDVLDSEQLILSTGVLEPNMQRGISYDVIELPRLERLILSCDERGNRTYVFDTEKLHEFKITPEMIKCGTKSQLNELLAARPEVGKSINYSLNYVERVRGAIENPGAKLLPEKDKAEQAEYLKVIEKAPEGWMTANRLAKELDVSFGVVMRRYNEHIGEVGPLTTYKTSHGKTEGFKYFSPEQVEKMKQIIEDNAKTIAPEGWMTMNGLAKVLGVGYPVLARYYDAHANEIGQLTEYSRDLSGETYKYFSPDQINEVKQHFAKSAEAAPEGWMTLKRVAQEIGANSRTLTLWYDAHANEIGQPTEYKNVQGKVFGHFSPDQIEKIRQGFAKNVEVASAGWMTASGLAQELSVGRGTIMKWYAEHTSEIGPLMKYVNVRNKVLEYFSPEQAEKIKQALTDKGERAPEGYMTAKALAKMLNISREAVVECYKRYIGYVGPLAQYVNAQNKKYEFFSPEQIEKLSQLLGNRGETVSEAGK